VKANRKNNNLLLIAAGALLLAIIGYLLFQNYQLRQKLTPPQPPTAIPLSDETANWKTYTNSAYNFSFKYPQNWKINMDQPNKIYVTSPTNFALIINYKVKGDSLNIVRSGVGAGDLVSKGIVEFGTKTVNKDVLVFQNQDKGILYDKSGEISVDSLVFSLSVDNLRSAAADYPTLDKQTEDQTDQILSTFQFTGENAAVNPTAKPVTQLTHSLPSSWKTAQDTNGTIEIGYNPETNDPSTTYISGGVAATGKWESNPTRKIAGNYTARISTYDGGSRHTTLQKGLSDYELKSGEWKASGYFEKEYKYSNWPCLVIFGFSVSQWPATQGICPISNSQAIYFTADSTNAKEVEIFIQTIKLL